MPIRGGRRGRRVMDEEQPLPEEVEMEENLRRELENKFKPMFAQHGREGLPLKNLRDELIDEGITENIPDERVQELLMRADGDGDAHITYKEFMAMMTRDLTKAERSAFRSVLRDAIADILPKHMREDFIANYTCCPPPIFMITISIVEIIVFVVYALELKDTSNPVTANTGVPSYSPLIYLPKRRYEAWRFVTYMFIHQGYLHIISNLIFQLLLGLPLEMVNKFWRILIIYVLGVIAGSLAHSVTDHDVALAGASGGCYALIGAHIASVIVNWKEMNYKCFEGNICRFLLSAPVRLTLLLTFSILDTGNAVYRRFFDANATTKIGISAHIGGLLAGLLLGIPILKNIKELPWEKTLGWITLAVYLIFVSFAMFFNGLYPGYPETDWTPL
ncbi:rhomboid-related protein 2-like [Pecten maximus]|uniref:rhomboid-related protein 2-like n=1 Tax=Pecten maximus TaxID=6579 RepID=UPI001458C76C|nr:rhomboid-related protein 2-like [Pecten maximus]